MYIFKRNVKIRAVSMVSFIFIIKRKGFIFRNNCGKKGVRENSVKTELQY